MDFLLNFLTFALPGGFLGSVVTWFASRRQRNNDFLAELQKSIDLLTEKYTKVLEENIILKADNAKLLANQAVMEQKIDTLTRTVEELKNQLKPNTNDKQNKRRTSPAAHVQSAADILRTEPEGGRKHRGKRSTSNGTGGRTGRVSRLNRSGVPGEDGTPGDSGFDGLPQGGGGGDTSGLGTDPDTDTEHR